MMEPRPPKESDQDETEKAYKILQKTIRAHSEIEPSLWFGAFMTCLANGCQASNLTYEEFCELINHSRDFYKHYWEESYLDAWATENKS